MAMRYLAALAILFALSACVHVPADPANDASIRSHPERFVLITLHNAGGESAMRAGSSPREYGPAMQYATPARTRAAAREIAHQYQLSAVREWPISQLSVHCVVYRIDTEEAQTDLLKRLRNDPRVESAQPLNSFSTLATTYNDPYSTLQRNLSSMGVPQAHALSRGKGVSVAVIDTAVDVKHQDFAGSHISARNFTGLPGQPGVHGTAVAGVIAATGGNHLGIVGVAPEAQVHTLAACWPDAANPARAMCDSFTLAAALAKAIELKANVVNLSLGGPADPLLRRLVEYGLARRIVFVAALPESGSAAGFPSGIPGVVVVDAVGRRHEASDVLLAPGTDILTLVPQDRYDFMSGSSIAAANVSGSIALLLSRHSNAHEVRDALAHTAPSGDSINVCIALAGSEASQQCGAAYKSVVQRSSP